MPDYTGLERRSGWLPSSERNLLFAGGVIGGIRNGEKILKRETHRDWFCGAKRFLGAVFWRLWTGVYRDGAGVGRGHRAGACRSWPHQAWTWSRDGRFFQDTDPAASPRCWVVSGVCTVVQSTTSIRRPWQPGPKGACAQIRSASRHPTFCNQTSGQKSGHRLLQTVQRAVGRYLPPHLLHHTQLGAELRKFGTTR